MKIYNGTVCIGIIKKNEYEEITCNDYFKQFMINQSFCLPKQKPAIESILEVIVESKITRSKIINTPNGKKIIYHGVIKIKIIYVADNNQQSVHSAHFSQHFYNFINLDQDDSCVCHISDELCVDFKIKSFIEDIEPVINGNRKIDFLTLILVTVKLCKNKGY